MLYCVGDLKPSGPNTLASRWTRVRREGTVEAPIDRVWSVVSDHTQRTAWYTALDEFVPMGEATSGVGATFREREWAWKSTVEIVEWSEGRHIGMSTRTLNMPGLLSRLYTQFELEAVSDDSTVVTITGGFRLGWLGWVLAAYTYPQMLTYLWVDYRSAMKGLQAVCASSV